VTPLDHRPIVITVSDFPSSGSRLTGAEIVRLCQLAEDAGIERFTISDFPFYRDLVPLMTACLVSTRSIMVESLVTSPHYRLPETTACTFATMADLSSYRAILGLGRGGVPLNIPPWGRERPNPLAAMQEMVELCRAMWTGATAPPSAILPSSEMALNFPVSGSIPILIAGGGRQMLALAGRLADIVHVASPFLSTVYLRELTGHIHAAAARHGRAESDYEVDITVAVSVLPDASRAKRLAKVTAAMGISWMAERARAAPVGAPLPDDFAAVSHLVGPITSTWRALGDAPFPDELADLIDDTASGNFSVAGDPEECRERLVALVRALPGVTGVRVKLPSLTGADAPGTYAEMIRCLGDIAPAVRAARATAPQ
jgi:alkanesulfonate monooxygenase SsuD/methylene tetrahydromethanopterin reductase-like flavin-dependent oxidoreductase (luciferase family)